MSAIQNRSTTNETLLSSNGRSIHHPAFCELFYGFYHRSPPGKGHDAILVIVDQGLTKGIILVPCSKTITTEKTVQLLLENLYKRFELLDKIISD